MVNREASCFSGFHTSPLPSQHHGIQKSWNWLLHWLMAQPSFGMPWQVGDDDDDDDDDFFTLALMLLVMMKGIEDTPGVFRKQNQSVYPITANWFQKKIGAFFPGMHVYHIYSFCSPKPFFGKVNNW